MMDGEAFCLGGWALVLLRAFFVLLCFVLLHMYIWLRVGAKPIAVGCLELGNVWYVLDW